MTISPVSIAFRDAERVAKEAVHSKDYMSGRRQDDVAVHNTFYFWPIGQSSESNKKDNTVFLGIAAIITILAGSYFLARDAALLVLTNAQHQRLHNQKLDVLASNDPRKYRVNEVFDLEEQILHSTRLHALIGIVMKTALVAFAAMTGIGLLTGSAGLVGGSILAALGISIGLIFRAGYLDGDTLKEECAEQILYSINKPFNF